MCGTKQCSEREITALSAEAYSQGLVGQGIDNELVFEPTNGQNQSLRATTQTQHSAKLKKKKISRGSQYNKIQVGGAKHAAKVPTVLLFPFSLNISFEKCCATQVTMSEVAFVVIHFSNDLNRPEVWKTPPVWQQGGMRLSSLNATIGIKIFFLSENHEILRGE